MVYASGSGSGKCARRTTSSVCLVLVVALVCLACTVQGQFFTKANSKSIPRMGRRSLADPSAKIDIYRRMLIDRLVDEFGPDMLAQLRPEIKLNPTTGGQATTNGGELYMRNDQPFDMNIKGDGQQQLDMFVMDPAAQMSRDERSAGLGGDSSVTRQSYNKNTKSLAMRAFNTDRLLQHLASGGSPMLTYGNSFVEPKEQRNGIAYD